MKFAKPSLFHANLHRIQHPLTMIEKERKGKNVRKCHSISVPTYLDSKIVGQAVTGSATGRRARRNGARGPWPTRQSPVYVQPASVWPCVLCRWQWAAAVTVISDRVPFLVAKRVVAVEKDSTSAKKRVYLLMTRALRKAQRSRSPQLCSMYRPSSTSCVAFVYRRTVLNCPYSRRRAPSGTSPTRYWRASRSRWVPYQSIHRVPSCRGDDKSDATICASRIYQCVSLPPAR